LKFLKQLEGRRRSRRIGGGGRWRGLGTIEDDAMVREGEKERKRRAAGNLLYYYNHYYYYLSVIILNILPLL